MPVRRRPDPSEIVEGADIFLGLSAANVLKPEMVKAMAERPLILALANPDPEIRPELAKEVRPDAIIATGRSDYPNQVNNVLCFPFIFRGALDVGASTINEEMKLAAIRAIAELAQAEQSDVVTAAYGTQDISFGPDYLIPRPFDPRLITKVAPAVAQAAMESGVATRPLPNVEEYRRSPAVRLHLRNGDAAGLCRGGRVRPQAHRVRGRRGRPCPSCAAQVVVDESLATPILVGQSDVIAQKDRRRSAFAFNPAATSRSPASTIRMLSLKPRRPITSAASGTACPVMSPRPRCGATAP